jgi:hypothetical protein
MKGVFVMDVSESENVTEETGISSVPTERTMGAGKFNNEHDQLVNAVRDREAKVHLYITTFVLGLLLLIVVYALLMQNYWLVGTVCFPVIAYGVYKVFDRYL